MACKVSQGAQEHALREFLTLVEVNRTMSFAAQSHIFDKL
jgi:hypothetical protein